MLNVAWVARDGYADLFPMVQRSVAETVDLRASYLCHTADQAEHLRVHHGIEGATVIAHGVNGVQMPPDPEAELARLAAEYDEVPLIRCLWSTMFETDVGESQLARLTLSHLVFWEEYLVENEIDVLVYERPSILSSCIAWLVCQKLGVEAVDFVDTAVDTMTITNNWRGDYSERLAEKLSEEMDRTGESYHRAVRYVDGMRKRPTKTNEAQLASEITDRRGTLSLGKFLRIFEKIREHGARKEYFIYRNYFWAHAAKAMTYIARYHIHKVVNFFDKDIDPTRDKYFLFPLFMSGEWSNHVFMTLGYWDQIGTIRHAAQCLPIGSQLYVKEHHSMFAEHTFSFYKEIRKIRNVKLVSPFADTFELIGGSQGIVTLGSTMGFEALLMNKPVLLLGEPWYRVFPGLKQIGTPYEMAHAMQHLDEIESLTRDQCIQLAYAIFDISFDAVKIPRPGTLSDENVASFAEALSAYLLRRAPAPVSA